MYIVASDQKRVPKIIKFSHVIITTPTIASNCRALDDT